MSREIRKNVIVVADCQRTSAVFDPSILESSEVEIVMSYNWTNFG